MKTLVIDRGRWLTGTALKTLHGDSSLLHETSGLMCCLGFYGEACGLTPNQLMGRRHLTPLIVPQAEWLEQRNDGIQVEDMLTGTNDKEKGIHPARREAKIAKLFKQYGNIEVQFVGKYAEATSKARKVMKNAN